MLAQLWQDILSLISAISSHSLSAIILAIIALVTVFNAQVGGILSSIWTFIAPLFGISIPKQNKKK